MTCMICMNCEACIIDANVPVSSQTVPRLVTSTFSPPTCR